MHVDDASDIGALRGILVLLPGLLAWLIRRWIADQIEKLVTPHPMNDEQSVAKYAHEARDAARDAGEAAVQSLLDRK